MVLPLPGMPLQNRVAVLVREPGRVLRRVEQPFARAGLALVEKIVMLWGVINGCDPVQDGPQFFSFPSRILFVRPRLGTLEMCDLSLTHTI